MIVKIIATLALVLMLLFCGSWAMQTHDEKMQIHDEKREALWTRITDISGALMALLTVGLILVMIWND
jgi:hypothetical protein